MAIQELIQVLQEQFHVHSSLLSIADQKKEAIIQNDVDRLNQMVNRETKLLKRVSDLEEKRQFELSRYLLGKGYRPNPNITISEILRIVFRAEDREALREAQNKLLEVLQQLKAANDLNRQLVEQSLKFLNFSLDVLMGPLEDDSVYRHPDQPNQQINLSGMFDTRA